MSVIAYKINSFAMTESGGNPAGVVLHADEMSEEQMKAIAKEMNLSETAFVMKSYVADYKVRFFTPVDDFDPHLMPQIVSTGLKDIMVPIRSRSILDCIKPDFEKVTAVSKKYGVVGYHLFCKDTVHNSSAYCRNFAPLYGITEESATGTSSGALSCYLKKYEGENNADTVKYLFEQGYSMGKPSEIQVMLTMQKDEIIRVQVGGRALNIRKTILE